MQQLSILTAISLLGEQITTGNVESILSTLTSYQFLFNLSKAKKWVSLPVEVSTVSLLLRLTKYSHGETTNMANWVLD